VAVLEVRSGAGVGQCRHSVRAVSAGDSLVAVLEIRVGARTGACTRGTSNCGRSARASCKPGPRCDPRAAHGITNTSDTARFGRCETSASGTSGFAAFDSRYPAVIYAFGSGWPGIRS
jgi:hypothetical protein